MKTYAVASQCWVKISVDNIFIVSLSSAESAHSVVSVKEMSQQGCTNKTVCIAEK